MPRSINRKYKWQYSVSEIIKHIDLIVDLTKGMTFHDYYNDTHAIHLTQYYSIIIGENISRILREFRDDYPDIPWREIVIHRNELVHEYEEITAEDVWRVIQKDMPEMRAKPENLLQQDDT